MNHQRRVGLFGGSFNPIHVGHIALAKALRKEGGLDEVWFLVTPQNPWKQQTDLLDDEERLTLVRDAVRGEDGLVASDYEFHLPKPSYTLHTLRALRKDYPDTEFVLLIGGDNWAAFDHWYGYEEILRDYKIIVYPREEHPVDPPLPHGLPIRGVEIVHTPLLPVSSTLIRERVRAGAPIHGLVPEAIEKRVIKAYVGT
ncbi:MAG: nicotinate (nicotinamide) nucleotide adenylyltransferase [Prevotella sp.]|uniref:nicotinate (nicotinamide) nucleotide adenylyltransferase n=1 Tax=Prevotella sp. AGR2160 TaxID=1280674 RepID=UPI000408F612|nr:nicotinate (nicotinamide) nucleotide adenylyltransferase [Prevotella sp. AGR2160]MDD5861193.1 nicotinate (nicotinamide) nucleotide adenylyltransferase [Prevotella sp.]